MTFSITAFVYFLFIAISLVIYYLLPKKWQWAELLVFSLVFYYFMATPYTIVYMVISALLAWIVTNGMAKNIIREGKETAIWRIFMFGTFSVDVALWFVMKGTAFLPSALRENSVFQLGGALGMGYYTLQIIGYTVDCYWGNIEPQKNPLKLFLFLSFFPQLITGPISKYGELTSLYDKHHLSYINITHGTQRIVWGVMKKLVVAEYLAKLINSVWDDLETFQGLYVWIALLLYPIQMYADFSGCMDIVIGTAETFDIHLAENFRTPFWARTSQEFWQRWHITLGRWAKDYVLYPLLKTQWMINLGRFLRKAFGKKIGKFIHTSFGMLVLWVVIGAWHGAPKYVIGVSLWYWLILMLGDLLRPAFEKHAETCRYKIDSFGWHLFQSIRTYLIYAIGAVFFRAANIPQALLFIRLLVEMPRCKDLNLDILHGGNISANTGFDGFDFFIVCIALLMIIIVSCLNEKHGDARNWVDCQPIVFRWMVYIGLTFFVILYGVYGPGYDASAFIYGQF